MLFRFKKLSLLAIPNFVAGKTSPGRDTTSDALALEQLEDRVMLSSVVESGGVVTLRGSAAEDFITLYGNENETAFTVSINNDASLTQTFQNADVSKVVVYANDGDDEIRNTLVIPTDVFGNDGDDTIWGGFVDDRLYGGAGADVLRARSGDDFVSGSDGDDTLLGADGDDLLYGGDGHDLIYGQDGEDYLNGQTGDDRLRGGEGDDELLGGSGNDDLRGDAGNDSVNGGHGEDLLFGSVGADNLQGSFGNDILRGGDDNDILGGGDGEDLIYGDNGNDRILGGNGNDGIRAGFGDDQLNGGAGADRLWGQAGADTARGGEGHDFIHGGGEDDFLFGDEGLDRIVGGTGNDVIYGGLDHDIVSGGEGDDALYGEAGDDRLSGEGGNDILIGGNGDDTMQGNAGDDVLSGNAGSDTIDAGLGNDAVNGGVGDDRIFGFDGVNYLGGNGGNDQIDGGKAVDTIFGGSGNDLIAGNEGDDVLDGGQGDDLILGNDGDDSIRASVGDDSIEGNNGSDRVLYFSGELDFQVELVGTSYQVTDLRASDLPLELSYGVDLLADVEEIGFQEVSGQVVRPIADAVSRLFDSEEIVAQLNAVLPGGWNSTVRVVGDQIWLRTVRPNGTAHLDFRLGSAGVIAEIRNVSTGVSLLAPSFQGEVTDRVVQWTIWEFGESVRNDVPSLPSFEDRFNLTQAGTFDGVLNGTVDVDVDVEKGQVDVWAVVDNNWKSEQDPFIQGSLTSLTRTTNLEGGAVLVSRLVRVGEIFLRGNAVTLEDPYFEAWTPISDSAFDSLAVGIDASGTPNQWYADGSNIPTYPYTPVADTRGWTVSYDRSNIAERDNLAVVFGTDRGTVHHADGSETTSHRYVLNALDFNGGMAVLPGLFPGGLSEGAIIEQHVLLLPGEGIDAATPVQLDALAAQLPPPQVYLAGAEIRGELGEIANRLSTLTNESRFATDRIGQLL
jgi:Ca2+-binding RTX toxin-like protein